MSVEEWQISASHLICSILPINYSKMRQEYQFWSIPFCHTIKMTEKKIQKIPENIEILIFWEFYQRHSFLKRILSFFPASLPFQIFNFICMRKSLKFIFKTIGDEIQVSFGLDFFHPLQFVNYILFMVNII